MANCTNDFPSNALKTHRGERVVYFDNASCSQTPQEVLDVVVDYYRSMNGEVFHIYNDLGEYATEIARRTRQEIGKFIHAENHEVVFTQGATHALNLVASAWAMQHVMPGDQIALPISEHHSNLVPWQRVAEARGAQLVYIYPDLDGRIHDDEIEAKIGEKTRIVAASHISHVFGTEFPLRKLADRAHAVGAVTVFDCAQSLAHRKVDVEALGADFAAFSGRKAYAPAGTGFLYAKQDLLYQMEPVFYGSGMVTDVGERSFDRKYGVESLEAGGYNIGGMTGLVAALNYIKSVGYSNIMAHDAELAERFLRGVADNERIKVYGNPKWSDDRCGIVSFNYTAIKPRSIAKYLDVRGIAVSAGNQDASLLMGYFATMGMCRASFGLNNTVEDVDLLVEALLNVRTDFAKQFIKM